MVKQRTISRVNRSKDEARNFYDHISGCYDWLGGLFEREPAIRVLDHLKIQSNEIALEIGFGTGFCLKRIAASVGHNGKAYGLDISGGMVKKTKERLNKASLLSRVELYQGDAANLPFVDKTFDAVFISFTLELFDIPEIPKVLGEVARVLKPEGRLGIASLYRGNSLAVMAYEWIHTKWPKYIDCRPIYLTSVLQQSEFKIIFRDTMRIVILPVEIVIARKN